MNCFGAIIYDYRKDRALTLKALADRVGLSVPYVHDIENGRRSGSLTLAQIFAAKTAIPEPMLVAACLLDMGIVKEKMQEAVAFMSTVEERMQKKAATVPQQ